MKRIHLLLFVSLFAPLAFGQIVPKFGLGVNAGVAIPSGDMGDMYKTGFGGGVTLVLPIPFPVELSASIGYYRFGFNSDHFNEQIKLAGSNKTFDIDAPLNLIPVTVNARYYFIPVGVRPYAEVTAGIGIASLKSVYLESTSGGSASLKTSDVSETKQFFTIGAGVLVGVGVAADLDVNVKYAVLGQKFSQAMASGNSLSYSESNGSFLGINAGLRFKL